MDSGPVGSMFIQLLFVLTLILANAVLTLIGMSVLSIDKNKIKILSDSGNEKAKYLMRIINDPNKVSMSIQVLIIVFSFFVSAIVTTTISKNIGTLLLKVNIPFGNTIAIVFITLIFCYITLLLGFMVPKKVILKNPEKLAISSIKVIDITLKLAKPFIKLLSYSTNFFVKTIGEEEKSYGKKEDILSKDKIKSLIKAGKDQGALNSYEKDMMESVIEFDNKIAKDVMTPRIEAFILNANSPIREISSKLLFENFSRVPVYEKNVDNIIGILYMKDFFYEANKVGIDNIKIKEIIRKPLFIPETKAIDELFNDLKESKNHIAILLDEYGGFSGIVTIEDLIEEVMGDIFDEYDEVDEEIEKIDETTYLVDGLLSINELNDKLNVDIKTETFETIGGFVINLIGDIPKNDKPKIQYKNIIFEVEEISAKRIEKIKLCLAN